MEIAIWLQVEEECIPCVTFELLQNIDKNIVVIQFITKITITYQPIQLFESSRFSFDSRSISKLFYLVWSEFMDL